MKKNASKKILKSSQKQKGLKTLLRNLLDLLSIKHNFTAKILSLVFAIVFWVYVMDQVNPQITRVFYNVPVRCEIGAESEMVLVNEPTFFADIEVSGRRNDVLSMRTDSLALYVDTEFLREGFNILHIDYSSYMEDVSVDKIIPDSLKIQVEKIVSQPKRCIYELEQDFSKEFEKSKIKLSPSEIVVKGPRSKVNEVASLRVFITAEQMRDSNDLELVVKPYNLRGEEVKGVTMTSNSVNASIRRIKTKTVPLVFSYEDATALGFVLSDFKPKKKEVVIYGEPDIVDSVRKITVEEIVVSGGENVQGTFEFILPDGIMIENESSHGYTAEVSPVEEKEFVLSSSSVKLVGLKSHLEATLSEGDIHVLVRGASVVIDDLEADDVALEMDASNLGEGNYVLYPSAEVAGELVECQVFTALELEIVDRKE